MELSKPGVPAPTVGCGVQCDWVDAKPSPYLEGLGEAKYE